MKKVLILALGICIVVGIGGKLYMEYKKDKEELIAIQKDLADYLSTNYQLYTKKTELTQKIKKSYKAGNLSDKEYLQKMKETRVFIAIKKIEFTKFSSTPMNTVKVHFTINDVYKDEVLLDTISAETKKLKYMIGVHSGTGPYYLEEKENKKETILLDNKILYYHGGID